MPKGKNCLAAICQTGLMLKLVCAFAFIVRRRGFRLDCRDQLSFLPTEIAALPFSNSITLAPYRTLSMTAPVASARHQGRPPFLSSRRD